MLWLYYQLSKTGPKETNYNFKLDHKLLVVPNMTTFRATKKIDKVLHYTCRPKHDAVCWPNQIKA